MKNIENNKVFRLLALIFLVITTSYFITKTYLEIIKSPLILNVTLGSNNFNILLITLFFFFAGLCSLLLLTKKLNKKFIVSEVLEFVFLVAEITITLMLGLAIFISINNPNSATLIDIIGRPIYFICIALFDFFAIRALRSYFINKGIIKNCQ